MEQLVSTSQCGQSLQLWAVDSPSCAAQCHRRLRVPHPELATRQALAVDVLMHITVCIECSRDVSQRFWHALNIFWLIKCLTTPTFSNRPLQEMLKFCPIGRRWAHCDCHKNKHLDIERNLDSQQAGQVSSAAAKQSQPCWYRVIYDN